ncbi:MAG: dihydroneopterin aldolase [Bacteroidaceae bacterium]|nr:dihydroneopterin aldolase [Bacteroidaceae bacterium]
MLLDIHIDRLRIYARHGVLPQEQVVGADFYVSLLLRIEADEKAIRHDDLSGTISYADVIDTVRQEMQTAARLLESVALRIGERLLERFPRIESLDIRIDKENPPTGSQSDAVGVSLTLPQKQ